MFWPLSLLLIATPLLAFAFTLLVTKFAAPNRPLGSFLDHYLKAGSMETSNKSSKEVNPLRGMSGC